MRNRLQEILQSMGKTVVAHAKNGKEGIKSFKEHKPDLVFLDINMPELSGRDALIQIMNMDPEAKVVMCSTIGSEDIVAECIQEGAIHYLLKPFIKDNVIKTIKELEENL
ncbi:MAG: response regulator [Candidatus Caenarcaniphilales bacterium]|nr:response regulator [Candidatus Caenarcaniphilales bacterium]